MRGSQRGPGWCPGWFPISVARWIWTSPLKVLVRGPIWAHGKNLLHQITLYLNSQWAWYPFHRHITHIWYIRINDGVLGWHYCCESIFNTTRLVINQPEFEWLVLIRILWLPAQKSHICSGKRARYASWQTRMRKVLAAARTLLNGFFQF